LDGLDIIEANKNSGYNDRTTKERKDFENKKWIESVE